LHLLKTSNYTPPYVLWEGHHSISYYKESDSFFDFYTAKYPHHFYGTGDTLAALTTACILQDMTVEEALSFTLKFIDEVLQLSSQQPERIPFGLPIEKKLGMLTTKFTTEVSL